MNSLYNNLGPRRSRGGGGDIFISISIVISLIIIFYMVYKLIQRNKSENDKDNNNKDDTVLVPEISPPVMGMVLMPDKDNTNTDTEQYEIDNGKLETYKIEYETGTDINATLSKNVRFSVDWDNTIGFNTVNSITFTHYIKSFETNANYVSFKTEKVEKPESLGTDVISNYFKNGTSDNRFTFDGRAGDFNNGTIDYSVLGYNRIGISINYGDGDGTDIVVYGPVNDFNNDETSSAKVSQDDLAVTFELLTEKRYTFSPEETKNTDLSGTYIKNVYHVFPYKDNNFNNHLSSYLGTNNSCGTATTNNKKKMVSLNLVGASKDTFKIQIFPGNFDDEITNSDDNYLGFCGNDNSTVSGGTSNVDAISFIMVKPPTDIILPTDTPSDKMQDGTTFLGYKTFKVVDGTKDKFLVISNGLLKLKKWEDLVMNELTTMIMAFYVKNDKSCYSNETWYEKDDTGKRKPESERRHINNQCSSIFTSSGGVTTANKITNKDDCERSSGAFIYKDIRNINNAIPIFVNRGSNCEWRNPAIWDL